MVNTTGAEKQRISCLLGISAANGVLPLYAVFKGKKVPQDVSHFQAQGVVIAANQNAWLTEDTFHNWIDKVWSAYANRFDRTLLIMDSFRVHKLQSVLSKLESLKTDVLFIPAGLTFYCQPCDVYLNKPVKDSMRRSWQQFMINQQPDEEGN